MEIFKVIGVGIIGTIIAGLLKNNKSEIGILVIMSTGIIILILILNSLTSVIDSFFDIVDKSGINMSLFSGMLKIIGIGYLTEFSANLCEDYGCASIGKKIQFGGKITIFLMALPIISGLIEIIGNLLQ